MSLTSVKSVGTFQAKLARRWPEFVECERRSETMQPFLCRVAQEAGGGVVLDAAAGTACDAIGLAVRRWQVVANEIDSRLRLIGVAAAQQARITMEWTAVDWRLLSEAFSEAAFGTALILGNSFCLIHSLADRALVASQLRKVCRAGGRLVVDERNFRYIQMEREQILRGNFRYSGRVIYCGDRVVGRPTSISRRRVEFIYEDAITKERLGSLDMHSFEEGEIIDLFLQQGFKDVEVYSDLERGVHRDADFYTYVFLA